VADLSREQLRQLSRMGATARLAELRSEEAAIRQAFPELGRKSSAEPVAKASPDADAKASASPARSRSRMSPAARRAVSERMKRYWAERRKAKGAKK
jgi:hypothetical protein